MIGKQVNLPVTLVALESMNSETGGAGGAIDGGDESVPGCCIVCVLSLHTLI